MTTIDKSKYCDKVLDIFIKCNTTENKNVKEKCDTIGKIFSFAEYLNCKNNETAHGSIKVPIFLEKYL